MLKKCTAYLAYQRQERDKHRRADPQANHFFRVLFVTPTASWAAHLRLASRDLSSSKLFWFTDEARFSADPLGSVWQTPADDGETYRAMLEEELGRGK